jgi:hypothetical protein
MSDGKVRLVVGRPNHPAALKGALHALAAISIDAPKICIISTEQAFNREWKALWEEGQLSNFGPWILCRPLPGGEVGWEFRDSGRISANVETALLDARNLWKEKSGVGRQLQQLDRHLSDGGALLVVETSSDAEEHRVGSTLLLRNSLGVQTHDVRRTTKR